MIFGTVKVLLVGLVAAMFTFAGQWYSDPSHACWTSECLSEFWSHFVPTMMSTLVALFVKSPIAPAASTVPLSNK